MPYDDDPSLWSATNFSRIEAALWQEGEEATLDPREWLQPSWQQPAPFWKGLHAYWERRQACQSKSVPLSRYNFYYDLLERQKDRMATAMLWFEKGNWQRWSHAELSRVVNGLAANWETKNVQPGEILCILHPFGPHWLAALLAGLRLGLTVCVLPPQGNAFVRRRLESTAPHWLAIDQLYRHQLGFEWQEKVLPNELLSSAPARRPYEYPAQDVAALCFDPASPTPELALPVSADSLYLGALRDGIFGLGLKTGQTCAAPGWHLLESQPSLLLAVLLCGGAWLHIDLADLENHGERLLEQPIHVLGISSRLRDQLRRNPPAGEKPWRYWFRHPAESVDFTLWQDFVRKLQLEKTYSGNLLWNAAWGGAILFSPRSYGRHHLTVLPAAGQIWQLGIVDSPDLPCLGGWGRLALGSEQDGEVAWTPRPYLMVPYLNAWNYLGQYPQGRAGRTYPRLEVLDLLAGKLRYAALVEASVDRGGADPRHVVLAFGGEIDAAALQALIATELGEEFLPDRVEVLPFLPKLSAEGGADQEWCQFHYLSGELYRRQRSAMHLCLSELKRLILA